MEQCPYSSAFQSLYFETKAVQPKVRTLRFDGQKYIFDPVRVTVVLTVMTDSLAEAEEMREQWLAFDCVAEVVVLDEPDGSVCSGRAQGRKDLIPANRGAALLK
jgi:hypothetical protein